MKHCRNCGTMLEDEQEYCSSCGTKFQDEQNDAIDDITFIKAIKYIKFGTWNQYDILLAAQIYGWEQMKNWAEYMSKNDLDLSNGQITVGLIGGRGEKDITDNYKKNDSILNMPELECEHGSLSVAGLSNTLKCPTKIVWLNQTSVLRVFTLEKFDEDTMRRYIETAVRRTFGTPDEMKLAKPLPQNANEDNNANINHDCSSEDLSENNIDTNNKTKSNWLFWVVIAAVLVSVFAVVAVGVNNTLKQDEAEQERYENSQKAYEYNKIYNEEQLKRSQELQKEIEENSRKYMPTQEEREKVLKELEEMQKGN